MLFAMLFDGQDDLIAAAPAVFQYSLGDRYWRDVYENTVALNADCQTAYIDVVDDDLIDKLNSLESSDISMSECRLRVTELIGPWSRIGKQSNAA